MSSSAPGHPAQHVVRRPVEDARTRARDCPRPTPPARRESAAHRRRLPPRIAAVFRASPPGAAAPGHAPRGALCLPSRQRHPARAPSAPTHPPGRGRQSPRRRRPASNRAGHRHPRSTSRSRDPSGALACHVAVEDVRELHAARELGALHQDSRHRRAHGSEAEQRHAQRPRFGSATCTAARWSTSRIDLAAHNALLHLSPHDGQKKTRRPHPGRRVRVPLAFCYIASGKLTVPHRPR